MSIFDDKTKEKLRIARQNRITVESIKQTSFLSKRLSNAYELGYKVTSEALNHRYNADIKPK